MARALPAGFAIASVVWVVAFIGRLPALGLPGPLVFAAIVLVLLAGAFACGRYGLAASVRALVVTGVVNVLLVGSVATADVSPLIWIPGGIVATAAIGLLGGALRKLIGAAPPPRPPGPAGQRGLAIVVIGTGLCLVSVGGVVTSVQAGLSVPDWPNSYGYTMFLFPLSKMVGGIYYEHSHRLLGSLVGLETLVLAVWVWARPPDPAVRRLAYVALVLVIVQGTLGGLRVVLVNALGSDVALAVAVVHACMAQAFLLLMAVVGVRLVDAERRFQRPALTLAALILTQTLIGATIRHFHSIVAIVGHIVMALVIAWLILRAYQRHAPKVPAATKALAVAVALQIPLGVVVLTLTTLIPDVEQATSGWIALITAAHVALGATIIVLAGWAGLAPTAPRTPAAGQVGGHQPLGSATS